MDIVTIEIASVTLFKLASLTVGAFLSYLGYRLFMAGIWGNAGDAEGAFGNNRLVIKKAAPGTFFLLMGALVIALTIFKGLDFQYLDRRGGQTNEKPVLAN